MAMADKVVLRKGHTLAQRLYSHYTPEPNSGCWLWLGAVLPNNGMGMIRNGSSMELTHRVSYRLTKGEIPEGLKVLHKCDVPSCINPDHLFLGTQKDNVHDCMKKDRRSKLRGEDWHTSKLTWDQVREIRSSDESLSALARKFGVWPNAIKSIRINKSWKEN